jgi:hypothetical protein
VRYNVVKTIYRTFFLVGLMVLCSVYTRAQPMPCEPGDENCNGGGDPDLPIDGGASILIAAGVAYGLKKVHDKRKQGRKEELQ